MSPSQYYIFPIFLLALHFLSPGAHSVTFTITNSCNYPVWPGILSNAGVAPLATTGFALAAGQTSSVAVPAGWSGRLWGRTRCSTDPATQRFTCQTADCGSSTLECSGAGAVPPATLAEFTLNGANSLDFYDVSLVDGYNLPMLVTPSSPATTGSNCSLTGCAADLNGACPSELKVMDAAGAGEGVACKSACEAFGDPMYCCSGAYGTPDTCKPSSYSELFKNACPKAYSYAYDDGTSTFTCGSGGDYLITFCPSPTTSLKSTNNGNYPEAVQVSAGGARTSSPYVIAGAIAFSVGAATLSGVGLGQLF